MVLMGGPAALERRRLRRRLCVCVCCVLPRKWSSHRAFVNGSTMAVSGPHAPFGHRDTCVLLAAAAAEALDFPLARGQAHPCDDQAPEQARRKAPPALHHSVEGRGHEGDEGAHHAGPPRGRERGVPS